jgi:hypothetical protein
MNVSRPLLAVGLLLAVTGARAQLATNSPFLPQPGTVAAAGPAENTPIELRGIMAMGRLVRFCIYDTVHHTSSWVTVNERGYDFVVKTQDLAHDTVTVEQGGRTFPLQLREAKVASAGQAAAPVGPLPGPGAPGMNGPNPITQSVVLNPTPADEQQRLEAVSAEVRRRRALREQASQQAAGGAQPMVQPAAPAPVAAPAAQPQPVQPQGNAQQNQTRRRVRTQ